MATTLVTAPTTYPVTLAEIKYQLRITHHDSDSELDALITQATNYIEEQVGRRFITQTWKYTLDSLDTKIKLPYPPLQSVSSIQYQDSDNATQTLGSSNYTVDTFSHPGRVDQSADGSYPSTYNDINVVTITYVCGYGDKDDVPEEFKQAIKLYIQWIYDMDERAREIVEHFIRVHKINWFDYA